MKKIFQAIFGSPESMKKVIDGTVDGIDKMFYTEEEKAETMTARLEFMLKWLQATQPQNVARRFIAIIVTLLWAFLVVYAVVAFTIQYALMSADQAAAIEIADVMVAAFTFNVLKDIVAIPFAGIMTFYFAAHVIGRFQDGKK